MPKTAQPDAPIAYLARSMAATSKAVHQACGCGHPKGACPKQWEEAAEAFAQLRAACEAPGATTR